MGYIKNPKRFWDSKDKRVLLENYVSLIVTQGLIYILPLLIDPYLGRVIGVDKKGLIAFGELLMQYFILITNYGFDIIATQVISQNRKDKKKVSEIFVNVLFGKVLLALLCFLILLVLVLCVPRFTVDKWVYILSFGIVLGNLMYPIWYFQGMEELKKVSAVNFIIKIVGFGLIFILIKDSDSYMLVPVSRSVSFLIAGFVALIWAFRSGKLTFVLPDKKVLRKLFSDGFPIFISFFIINLYTSLNTLILGIISKNPDRSVGIFTTGEKIVSAVKSIYFAFIQTTFPRVSKLFRENIENAKHFIKKSLILVTVGMFLPSLILFVFSKRIILTIWGEAFTGSIGVLQILSFLPLIIAVGNVIFMQGLMNMGYKKQFAKISLIAVLISISSGIFLMIKFDYLGTALALLFTEFFITISMLYLAIKKRILW